MILECEYSTTIKACKKHNDIDEKALHPGAGPCPLVVLFKNIM